MIHSSDHSLALAFLSTDLTFRESVGLALIGGLVSLLLAAASGFIAFLTARSNFKRELQRIREQINVQKEVERREQIAALKQTYLAPLRYYAQILSLRFGELRNKFASQEGGRVRNWFKQIKDHVARDKELEKQLAKLGATFIRNNGEDGIWEPLQEVMGDAFTTAQGVRMSYAEMCRDQDAGDAFRTAPYLRTLDFYWWQLTPQKTNEIQSVLNELVQFLDSHDPQADEKLKYFLPLAA